MSIKITPHGYRADITVDSMDEAREVLRELTPTNIGCYPPVDDDAPYKWGGIGESDGFLMHPGSLAACREMAANLPPWDGFARESAAETAAGVPEEADVDLTDTAATLAENDGEKTPRNRTWTPQEESVLKRCIRDGLKCKAIGERLGRSSSSVRNKLNAMEAERAALNLTPIKPKKVTA